jgi:predicted nucleotide-binding protein
MPTTKSQIFVIQSFGKETDAVYELISSAAANAGVFVYRADLLDTKDSVLNSIHEAIHNSSLVIADVTDGNSNVMYEVGFARAKNKPLILISNSSRKVPYDLVKGPVLIYDLSNSSEFIESLVRWIKAALKNPDSFLFSQAVAEQEKRHKVFISYSHHDKEYLDRLLVHLKPLEKEGLIDLWVDTRLRAGDLWKKEIEEALQRATVAVLLVSADFLASDFITDNELPPLLRSAEKRGTRIIPLIVKPCRFTRDKNLRHFQSLNDPKLSLVLLSAGKQEVYYDRVAAEVERSLQRS